MALSNLERVNKGLELLRAGLHPFVLRELKAVHNAYWLDAVKSTLPDGHHLRDVIPEKWDTQALLVVMWRNWKDIFEKTLGQAERNIVSELMDARKRSAHQNKTNTFSTDDAYRVLDNVDRLLTAISAPEALEAGNQKGELLRVRFEESSRKTARRMEVQPIDIQTNGSLLPWRDLITPHADIASGRYQQAEFAADLWRVYTDGVSAGEYGRPVDFFQRTYLTSGLRRLLINALERVNGTGGDPVVNLQTNFGGGKTHSLLSIYHLFSGANLSSVRDLEKVFAETGLTPPATVYRAVIVGTGIAPNQPNVKPDGTVVHTLWGEIAWQLGRATGYEIVRSADESGSNPGQQLVTLFRQYSPCVILLDEWVAYVRQLPEEGGISGSYGAHTSFAQFLCEAAKAVDNVLVVVSIPASNIEMGGSRGLRAAEELGNIVGRIESPWSAATTEESFEIVTRRLFNPVTSQEQYQKRDAVAKVFADFYRVNQQEFPTDCTTADYEKRIRDFYPIHPELFDKLSDDWSSLEKFQKTRGILRLMAKIIHSLWENGDKGALILPASIPLDDSVIEGELMKYLDEPWRSVLHKDVDGANSLPRQIDADSPNLGRYSAARRVARTLFFGSAPTFNAAQKGIEESSLKLGSIFPGESIPTFSDALRRLTDRATYIYAQNRRYWYSTQNNVNRTAEERAVNVGEEKVIEVILEQLALNMPNNLRGHFKRVHFMPESSNEVVDEEQLRLIVLGIKDTHTYRSESSPARQRAKEILLYRGTTPRIYKNTLLFLASDAQRMEELKQAVQIYVAWKTIDRDKDILGLDGFQTRMVEEKCKITKDTIKNRIPETFIWLLSPSQPEPSIPDLNWDEYRLTIHAGESLAVQASRKAVAQSAIYGAFSGSELSMKLNDIPLWRGNHVSVKVLLDDFAKYLYLPRLAELLLLRSAMEEGANLATWQYDTFAFADAFNDQTGRYSGLTDGVTIKAIIPLQSNGYLVRSAVAKAQHDADKSASDMATEVLNQYPSITSSPSLASDGARPTAPVAPVRKNRYYGNVQVDALRLFRDIENIEQEIIKHLTDLPGAEVEVTIQINAKLPHGFTTELMRVISENSRTLKFRNSDFD